VSQVWASAVPDLGKSALRQERPRRQSPRRLLARAELSIDTHLMTQSLNRIRHTLEMAHFRMGRHSKNYNNLKVQLRKALTSWWAAVD
jgi:hypothetical protein